MANLPSLRFKQFSETGECEQFSSRVSVDSQGEFHLTFPEHLRESVIAACDNGCYVDETRKKTTRVNGGNLDDCKRALEAGLKDYLKCEVREETVIRYGWKTDTTYWKMPSGALYANGYDCRNDPDYNPDDRDSKSNGEWHGRLNATTHNAGYAVALFAKVQKKTTYTRPSGEKCKYGLPDFDHFDTDTWGERLNQFVGLNEKAGFMRGGIEVVEMPYTEEAAKFFYDMLIGMCAFADKIETFFAEPENVVQAIEAGGVKLLEVDK